MPQLRVPTLGEAVYERIRKMIFSGHIKPGNKINVEKISRMLDISQTPIREALMKLEKEGLVIYKPRFGWKVAKPSRSEFIQLHELQEILEQAIVKRILPQIDKIDFNKARKLNESMAFFVKNKEFDRILEENEKFHLYLYQFCPNKILIGTLKQTWDNIKWQRRIMITSHDYLNNYYTEHENLLTALESGDMAKIHDALHVHFITGLNSLEQSLDRGNT